LRETVGILLFFSSPINLTTLCLKAGVSSLLLSSTGAFDKRVQSPTENVSCSVAGYAALRDRAQNAQALPGRKAARAS
jgi:hypothetical protein